MLVRETVDTDMLKRGELAAEWETVRVPGKGVNF